MFLKKKLQNKKKERKMENEKQSPKVPELNEVKAPAPDDIAPLTPTPDLQTQNPPMKEESLYHKVMEESERERALKVHQSLEDQQFVEKQNSLLAKMLKGKAKVIQGPSYSLRSKKRRS
jgi:hypothetical protein